MKPILTKIICCSIFSIFTATTKAEDITPFLVSTVENFSTLDGGFKEKSTWNSLLYYGVELDLDALFSITGSTFHISGLTQYGDDHSADHIGDFNGASNIEGADRTALYQAWIQIESNSGVSSLRFGLFGYDDDFGLTEPSAFFLNSAFGALPTLSANIAAPIWPLAAPAFWIQTQIGEIDFQAGIYDGNADDEDINHNGLKHRLKSEDGAAIFVESALPYKILERPGKIKLGAMYHSGEFETEDGMKDGNYSLYICAEQNIHDNHYGAFDLFMQAGWSPQEDRNTVLYAFSAGARKQGYFPGREEDIAGIAFHHTVFSEDYLAQRTNVSDEESIIEVSYQFPITNYLTLQPDIQYILNAHESNNHTTIFGLRAEASF